MFLRLQIDNFAIIEHSRIEFHDGFSVLTGETGAGKSIIMDAISLLLGARAQKNMIRKNAESSSIQGVFMTKNKKALDFLEENRIPYEDVIIVERVLYILGIGFAESSILFGEARTYFRFNQAAV